LSYFVGDTIGNTRIALTSLLDPCCT